MTVIDIKNQLLSHFFDNSSFDMEDDGLKISLSDDLHKVRAEVIASVLQELEVTGMIKKVAPTVWLLVQPFDSLSQTIVLSASAGEIFADTINQFREANEIDADLCDKTRITEEDIMNLVSICHVLLDSDEFDDEFDEDEDEEYGEKK